MDKAKPLNHHNEKGVSNCGDKQNVEMQMY